MRHARDILTGLVAVVLATCAAGAQHAEPVSLEWCVNYALEHNPRITAARERIEAADARVGQAGASTRPQLDARAGYTDSRPASGELRNYSAMLSLRQLLHDGGQTSALSAQARSRRDATVSALRTLELDVAHETARGYIDVLRSRRLTEVAVEVREQATAHHAMAAARYDAGTVARADVLRAEVEIARARLDIVSAQKAEKLTQLRLLNALGMTQEESLEVGAIDLASPPPAVDAATATASAQANRSELAVIDAELAAAEAGLRAVRASQRPELSFQGDWGTRDDSFVPDDAAWSIGLSASMSLLDGGLTRDRTDEASAELRMLRADREWLLQQVDLEVAGALLDDWEARQRLELAEQEVAVARHSMEVAAGRYRAGEALMVEMIDARTALSRALAAQADALYDLRAAGADVNRAMGMMPTEELPAQ